MSIFQGAQQLAGVQSGTTQARSSESASTQYAPFALDYLSKLASAGTAQIPTSGQNLVAPMSGLTEQAIESAPGALTRYTTPLEMARGAAGDIAGGITASDISQFYNPYEQRVVDEMARQSAQNVERNLMPQLKAGFAGSGGFGSQRYAGALGQALTDVQSDLLGQQAKARAAGYTSALDAALRSAGLQGQAAQTLGQLGSTEQQAAVSGLKAASDLGTLQQAYEQSKIEAPIARLQNIGQILRGYQMQTQSSSGSSSTDRSDTGRQFSYGNSPLSQIAGTASLIGAVKPAASWLKGLFSSSDLPTSLSTSDFSNYNYPNYGGSGTTDFSDLNNWPG